MLTWLLRQCLRRNRYFLFTLVVCCACLQILVVINVKGDKSSVCSVPARVSRVAIVLYNIGFAKAVCLFLIMSSFNYVHCCKF